MFRQNKLKKLREITIGLNNFQVLPSISDANLLLESKNCLPIVWDVATGLGSAEKLNEKKDFFSSFLKKCDNVVIEKRSKFKYTIFSKLVLNDWVVEKENKFFKLFKRPTEKSLKN